jgi:hypothetical protein
MRQEAGGGSRKHKWCLSMSRQKPAGYNSGVLCRRYMPHQGLMYNNWLWRGVLHWAWAQSDRAGPVWEAGLRLLACRAESYVQE